MTTTSTDTDAGGMRVRTSAPDLLVLHAVRLSGMADDEAVARRVGVPRDEASELLLDAEAFGWVTRVEFGASQGWAITDRGRVEHERRLAAELDAADSDTGTARSAVERAHRRFEELNGRLVAASTDWQLHPTSADRFAANTHNDPEWDERILSELAELERELRPLIAELAGRLARFEGYDDRFAAALDRARGGDPAWVTGIGIDSCHVVWMELHQDLLSTLGLERG